METLTVTLKQHTPLIHFQHSHEGATLRASEVKPMLDKFLLKKLGRGNYENGIKQARDKGWLIGKGEHPALDYKMRIVPSGEKNVQLKINGPNGKGLFSTDRFGMLLSNMGGKKDKEELTNLVLHDQVEIKFFIKCHGSKELKGFMRNELSLFFALNNFGQRKTKGFGSFTVYEFENENETVEEWGESRFYEKETPIMFFELSETKTECKKQKIIFDVIEFYWKCLKAGINYTKGDLKSKYYIKSFLYYYLNKNCHCTWEKRKIKQYFHLGRNRRPVINNPNTPIFARALLGCPDKYVYSFNKEVKVAHVTSMEENRRQKIERIPSPIYLKPVCSGNMVRVYILFNSEIIDQLSKFKEKVFRMEYNGRTLDLNMEIFLHEENWKEFIRAYHKDYLSRNKKVLDALYCNDPIKDYKVLDGYRFVPRDISWNNILGEKKTVGFNDVGEL